jgi:exodeoxyribonuclease VII small subunit
MTKTPQPVEKLTYEQALVELEDIVARLEAGQAPLEEEMSLFERGQVLAQQCASLLDKAELKVEQLGANEISAAAEEEE